MARAQCDANASIVTRRAPAVRSPVRERQAKSPAFACGVPPVIIAIIPICAPPSIEIGALVDRPGLPAGHLEQEGCVAERPDKRWQARAMAGRAAEATVAQCGDARRAAPPQRSGMMSRGRADA